MNERGRRFLSFWKQHGTAAVVRLIRVKMGDAISGRPILNKMGPNFVGGGSGGPATAPQLGAERFAALQALRTYLIPQPPVPRLSLITDSIGSGSLFGGVGTALLLAAQLANRMDATLRIVTRNEEPSASNAALILGAFDIQLKHEIQFAFAPPKIPGATRQWAQAAAAGLDIHANETFLTTSWWTTAAMLRSVPPPSIIYLLQEDERMFYPFGEDRAFCDAVLRNRDIRVIINTRLLYDHFVASGLNHLDRDARWFEPAFPRSLFHERPREPGGKKRFFFYARPNNPRNLFHIGLEVIDRAINEGVLDLAQWDLFLVGKDIPNVVLGDGYLPTRCEGLDWKAYADLVGTIDLGLSLMYTPHPSYPPLDLAASGAVVVTNKCGNKQDLSSYSRNIICADLDSASLLEGIKAGVALANDRDQRHRNLLANGLGASWSDAFEVTLQSLTAAR